MRKLKKFAVTYKMASSEEKLICDIRAMNKQTAEKKFKIMLKNKDCEIVDIKQQETTEEDIPF
jgi:hypothetical protein